MQNRQFRKALTENFKHQEFSCATKVPKFSPCKFVSTMQGKCNYEPEGVHKNNLLSGKIFETLKSSYKNDWLPVWNHLALNSLIFNLFIGLIESAILQSLWVHLSLPTERHSMPLNAIRSFDDLLLCFNLLPEMTTWVPPEIVGEYNAS